MDESSRIVLYLTFAGTVVTSFGAVVVAIRSNYFKSKCCGGFCEMEDDLHMQDKSAPLTDVVENK